MPLPLQYLGNYTDFYQDWLENRDFYSQTSLVVGREGFQANQCLYLCCLPRKWRVKRKGLRTNSVPCYSNFLKKGEKNLVTLTTPMHQINEGSICFFRRSSNPGEPWNRCTESGRSFQQRRRGWQRLLGAGEHRSLVAQKGRTQTHKKGLFCLLKILFCLAFVSF